MSAPLPPGRVRPANPQPGEQDERCGHHEASSPAHVACQLAPGHAGQHRWENEYAVWEWQPAPSAGQDTGQLRDELESWLYIHSSDEQYDLLASELVDGPLARLIAERDEARAQVQRVEALAAEMEDHDANLCDAAATEAARRFDLAAEAAYAMQARDLRMDASRIRRALDDPEHNPGT